ncbi:hypothetical protein SAMN05444277_114112 [Parafilimonas terrae]|jgi:hypothetical protein|uniref:Uncharacterized protein n=1 Tax=Parafilimonas terrae TaxID=1465490 RepID=A0A1I5YXZ7_9BACT|nr:hypothetical protein SAMN05444277_114112 [Parafilimonas terrae]
MTIQEIKDKLVKKAVVFSTGGFRPANSENESFALVGVVTNKGFNK